MNYNMIKNQSINQKNYSFIIIKLHSRPKQFETLMKDSSVSPNKRSSFRSKNHTQNNFKQSLNHENKQILSFKAYMKQFPLDIDQQVLEIVKFIEPVQEDFIQNLKSLKLYKQQLGVMFQSNWMDILNYLKVIVIRMNKRSEKLIAQKQNKISQLLNTIKTSQINQINLKQKLQKIQNLRQLENAQLITANNQLQIVNKQMNNIYKILQTDMSKVLEYLTTLQEKKAKQNQQGSNQIYASLHNLNTLINSVQKQQEQTESTLSTMKEMIKAMTKNTKIHIGVQVDESQLQTKVEDVFTQKQEKTSFDNAQTTSVNINQNINEEKIQTGNMIEKLKLRQKDLQHQTYNPKKNIDKPWALTPTLLVFLQNMSKQNQSGRVLPWQYTKQVMTDIYNSRISYESQMTAGMVGNSMLFDQFVVFFFISKFKIRRLAQVKLLEFIISLKYYSKFWPKAQLFCQLMDVMKYLPLNDPNDSPSYKFDYYAQNFFFSIYRNLSKFDLINDDDGAVYIAINDVRKLLKASLFFTDELSKSRISARVQKNMRIFNKVQCCDFDYAIILLLDEYFGTKKRNTSMLTKAFSKKFEQVQGYLSINQLVQVFDCLKGLYKKGEQFSKKFPINSNLQICKLYLYSITSGKNSYQIYVNNFIQACQKYGFDSPYPFLHACSKSKQKQTQENQFSSQVQISKKQTPQSKFSKDINFQNEQENDNRQKIYVNANKQRIDIGAKLFSQHFSILKELNEYVKIFQQTLKSQKDPQILWRNFNQIRVILQRGCQFLKFPLVKEKIK